MMMMMMMMVMMMMMMMMMMTHFFNAILSYDRVKIAQIWATKSNFIVLAAILDAIFIFICVRPMRVQPHFNMAHG